MLIRVGDTDLVGRGIRAYSRSGDTDLVGRGIRA